MSVERSFEAWEEVQRHGLDLADRLAQGFNGLLLSHIAPHAFSWPAHNKIEPVISPSAVAADGVSAILDIGNRLGQAGAELGAGINGVVQQFFRKLPVPFWHQEDVRRAAQLRLDLDSSKGRDEASEMRYSGDSATGSSEIGLIAEQFGSRFFLEPLAAAGGVDESEVEERLEFDLSTSRCFKKPQGIVNMTSTYNSRTNGIESSLVARGDLWRVEASRNGSASRNDTSPPILIQLGPLLFVRDTTVLLPVHLSKQHLLWYGYDRKTFVDLQFPNGQLTYVAGEGLTTSAFLPVLGGLLQAQSQYPGDTKLSFSCKYKTATCITPMVQWPDKSFSLGFEQDLAWKRSGLILRPTIQFSLCPTFGGNNPGLLTELTYSLEERLNLSCGYSLARQPSAFATVALGRSKWNGNAGNVGVVIRAEIPLSSVGRSSFSVQLNSGMEF
ncbi:uncharacterized protein LOC121985718 isoform X2 [Zingiber officinale]|uniref:uncharacterized protein LOC121985718 isoform X2 n=1 Tax=Zingiber officinale TaxID=94328 RepID=UPI001C4BC2D0|nr:uncharacterized protein LOC121985718 isoform X2 [Zingiber officinale]